MRALEREVVDVLWRTIEPLLPPPDRSHPLGCHRPRADDYLCFRGILIRLVTGASRSAKSSRALVTARSAARVATPRYLFPRHLLGLVNADFQGLRGHFYRALPGHLA